MEVEPKEEIEVLHAIVAAHPSKISRDLVTGTN